MAPKQKTWAEVNKSRKEERRKRKEEKLAKQLKQAALQRAEKQREQQQKSLKKPKLSTISIAVPGSILENAQTPQLRAYLAGQIARAACIYQVDEVIVFDDNCGKTVTVNKRPTPSIPESCTQLARVLQYLECPQYLRKHIFPMHEDLKFIGVANPLDAPSHLRIDEEFPFREGIVKSNGNSGSGSESVVDVGLHRDVLISESIQAGVRVTIKLDLTSTGKKLKGTVVPPSMPRAELGSYWGYTVRLATSLSEIFTKSPFKNGYDATIGTSDKGASVDDLEPIKYKHLLVVFGGLPGLETALENDTSLTVQDPSLLFDHYLNTIPNQGSRTVRTEEAILISLAALRAKLQPKYTSYSTKTIKKSLKETAESRMSTD